MIRIFHHYISTVFLALFIVEYCVFFGSMYFGSQLYFYFSITAHWYEENNILIASFLFASSLSLCLAGIGLYRRSIGLKEYELLSRTAIGFSASILITVSTYYFYPQLFIGRGILSIALVVAVFSMLACRFVFNKLAEQSILQKKILVLGCGNNAHKIVKSNNSYIHKGFKIIGCFSSGQEKQIVDSSNMLNEGNLQEIIQEYDIDEIVVALDDRRTIMPVNDLLECKMSGLEVIDLLSFYEREMAYLDLQNLQPSWLVFSDGFAQSGIRTLLKRLIDIVASLTLLILALPIMLLTVIAICIESGFKAPILYRQIRVGENNQNFQVLKFRSMKTDAESQGVQFAKENDDRTTFVGNFIRKVRIDELPQIFNVFKGDMSFVGPRPERPEFVDGFEKNIPFYRERHRVKPGITGWAQLCYPYGANEYDAIQKLQYDLYYVKNYSLFLDLTIILHTVEIILWGKGAR
ncbi:MAG: TIGR03013 family PEP-CTERM/XrtA system glycosyltransferase [Methylococcales bacterium]|nr:TIGR03013 family PEP-CTERM/XrtA system glycosyltransferase [Methylococcales bacterium]